MKRIISIDIVRGIIMVIMALDHVRDLMHAPSIAQSPTDLATTTPLLFFTRWITYLCAPIFVFLAGTSAFLSLRKNNDYAASSRFLLTRGLWLILLEFTAVNFGLFFDTGFHTLLFEVIATIGVGFIGLALLLKISPRVLGIIGLIIIFGHNLLPLLLADGSLALLRFTSMLYSPGAVPLFAKSVFVMAYPPLPWLGIMLVGFACGKMFHSPAINQPRLFLQIGISALLLFVLVRFANVYGDPVPWSTQKTPVYTFLSFLNVTKYPPSLSFCLVTLGVMFCMLAFAGKYNRKIQEVAIVYGKVPLFYFVLHFYLIHILTLAMLLLQGFSFAQLQFAEGTFGRPKGVESGLSLGWVYLLWMVVIVLMYKPCQWIGRYKATNKSWWLRYV